MEAAEYTPKLFGPGNILPGLVLLKPVVIKERLKLV